MKALSIRQPWASLIAEGEKTIETRTWATKYRGPLLIVSSKALWLPDKDYLKTLSSSEAQEVLAECQALPLGQAIAICDIVDCRPMTTSDEPAACCDLYNGAFSWVLSTPRRIQPFPVKGRLGLFEVQYLQG